MNWNKIFTEFVNVLENTENVEIETKNTDGLKVGFIIYGINSKMPKHFNVVLDISQPLAYVLKWQISIYDEKGTQSLVDIFQPHGKNINFFYIDEFVEYAEDLLRLSKVMKEIRTQFHDILIRNL